MKSESIIHIGVNQQGKFENGDKGSVLVKGSLLKSKTDSDDHWISVLLPLNKKGEVHGIKISFDNKQEKEMFMKQLYPDKKVIRIRETAVGVYDCPECWSDECLLDGDSYCPCCGSEVEFY